MAGVPADKGFRQESGDPDHRRGYRDYSLESGEADPAVDGVYPSYSVRAGYARGMARLLL